MDSPTVLQLERKTSLKPVRPNLFTWEAEATLQGGFKVKVRGKAPEGMDVRELVEELVELLVVEKILTVQISVSSHDEQSPLEATFTDEEGQVLRLQMIQRRGITNSSELFQKCVLKKLIGVLSEASYCVVKLNKRGGCGFT